MASLLRPKSTRREFLKMTGLSLGTILTGACVQVPVRVRRPSGVAHWALLADTHVSEDPEERYRDFLIDDNMRRTVEQIVVAAPEGAVIDGDCARLKGKLYDYDMLWRLLGPMREHMPVAMALGNHDNRENYRKVFCLHGGDPAPVEGKHVLVIDDDEAAVRLVILDSLRKVNDTPGTLGEAQRLWLKRFLDRADRRATLLFFHHPPTGGGGDLLDTDALLEIVLPRRQVKALFYGHTHVHRYRTIEDLQTINIPAVGYNFNDREPVGWLDARLTRAGGEFTLRTVGGNQSDEGKTTSVRWRV